MNRECRLVLMIALWLSWSGLTLAQNRVLIVTDSVSGILPRDRLLDSLLAETGYVYDFASYIPDPVDVRDFSALIITSRSAAISCHLDNLDRYVRSGGGLICGAGIPYYLLPDGTRNPITDWFGCLVYANASGTMYSTAACSMLGIADRALLDSTACGIGFGGFNGPSADVSVLARWTCGNSEVAISALARKCGKGRALYMSRMTSTDMLRRMFLRGIAHVQEYVWGDADNSGNVDIDDIMFLVDYVFGTGIRPGVLNAADPSGDGQIDIDDIVRLIGWVFEGRKDVRAGRIE